MAPAEFEARVGQWIAGESWVSIHESQSTPEEPAVLLDVVPGETIRAQTLAVRVSVPPGTSRVGFAHRMDLPRPTIAALTAEDPGVRAANMRELNRAILARPGLVTFGLAQENGEPKLELGIVRWLDGMSQDAFLGAIVDVLKTREVLLDLFPEVAAVPVPPSAQRSGAALAACPSCRTPLAPGGQVCVRCGWTAAPAPQPAPAAGQQRACAGCGAPLAPGARFCTKCGAAN